MLRYLRSARLDMFNFSKTRLEHAGNLLARTQEHQHHMVMHLNRPKVIDPPARQEGIVLIEVSAVLGPVQTCLGHVWNMFGIHLVSVWVCLGAQ